MGLLLSGVTEDPTGGNEPLSCVSGQAEPQEEAAAQICLERGTTVGSRNGKYVTIFNNFLHVVNFFISALLSISLGKKTKTNKKLQKTSQVSAVFWRSLYGA